MTQKAAKGRGEARRRNNTRFCIRPNWQTFVNRNFVHRNNVIHAMRDSAQLLCPHFDKMLKVIIEIKYFGETIQNRVTNTVSCEVCKIYIFALTALCLATSKLFLKPKFRKPWKTKFIQAALTIIEQSIKLIYYANSFIQREKQSVIWIWCI